MPNTEKITAEERLSHISSRLSDISQLLQMSNQSATSIIAELQCEIEDIYISLGGNDDDAQTESEDSDG